MNDTELKDIVREVLKKVLDGQKLPEVPDKIKPSTSSKNLARWLGHEPTFTRKPQSAVHTVEKTTPSTELSPINACADKNFIPDPNKPGGICEIVKSTPARIGVWRTGTRYLTRVALKMRADHAVAKDAVYAELKPELAQQHGWTWLETKATSKEEFLLRPDLGRQLSEKSLHTVKEKGVKSPDIQITVADGLSAIAAERYAKPTVDQLLKLFSGVRSVGTVFCVRYSRIAIQDVIGEAVGAKVSIILLGERPGLGSGDSLSNYMIFGPKVGAVNADKSMISNIHPQGYPPEEAAQITFEMIEKMFQQNCSGIRLKI